MSIADALGTHLPAMRAQAETLMVDRVTISRSGGEREFDETTGEWTTPAGTSVYSGKAKIRLQGVSVGYDLEVGGGDIRINTLILTVPVDTAIAKGDTVHVDESEDADMVGRDYRITDVMRSTWRVARKAMLEEVG